MRVGPLSAGPGALSTPSSTPTFTRWPAQWTNTNGITAPLFQCTQHTDHTLQKERERGGRLWCQPRTAQHERELMGPSTLHNMALFWFADLLSHCSSLSMCSLSQTAASPWNLLGGFSTFNLKTFIIQSYSDLLPPNTGLVWALTLSLFSLEITLTERHFSFHIFF